MSFKALRLVLTTSHHKGDEQLLLLRIADCIDNSTGEADPSVGYLMERTGMGERQVYRTLKRLKAGGELQIVSGKGCRQRNRYRLTLSPSNTDTRVSINTVTEAAIPPPPNTDKSNIGILTNRQFNTDTAAVPSYKNPIKKPIRAVTDVPAAHPRSVKRRKQTTTKTPWPDTLLLTAEMRQYAIDKGVADPELQFERFRNHAESIDRQCAGLRGWRAAWRNWCLGAPGYASKSAPPDMRPISPYGPPKTHAPDTPVSDVERKANQAKLRDVIASIGNGQARDG